MYRPKYVIPPKEREFMNDLEEIAVQKLFDDKSTLNQNFGQLMTQDNEIYKQFEKQYDIVRQNQIQRLEQFENNFLESTELSPQKESELVQHQSKEKVHEIENQILDYLQFKAKILISQFPKQAKYFLDKGWKSPIRQPEEIIYPFRPQIEGEYDEYKSDAVTFPNFTDDTIKMKPNIQQIMRNIKIGDHVLLHLPEDVCFSGTITKCDEESIYFVIDDDDNEINIPIERFANQDVYFQLDTET